MDISPLEASNILNRLREHTDAHLLTSNCRSILKPSELQGIQKVIQKIRILILTVMGKFDNHQLVINLHNLVDSRSYKHLKTEGNHVNEIEMFRAFVLGLQDTQPDLRNRLVPVLNKI